MQNARIFSSLKVPAYRLFLTSQIFEVMAMNIVNVVRPLLAYRLTESPAMIGIIAIFQAIPTLLVGLFAGVIADRFQKKYVMLACEIGMTLLSLVTALTLLTGYVSSANPGSWWVLAVGAVFQGIIMGIMGPSRQAIVPEYVGDDKLLNAASLQGAATNSMKLVIPIAAGLLVDRFDFYAAYFAITAAFCITSIFVFRFPLSNMSPGHHGNALTSIKEGLSYVRHNRTVLIVLSIALVSGFLSMPYQQLLAVLADDVLKVGAKGFGLLMSFSGAGSIAGALLIASIPNKKRGLMLMISIIVAGVSLVIFSASTSWPLLLGIMVFVGLGETVLMVMGNTLVQYYSEKEYRGRVISLIQMQMAFNSFGTFFAGVLSESIGVQWALGSFATLLVLLAVFVLAFVPRVRNLN